MKFLFVCGASRSVIWFRKELIDFLLKGGNEVHVVACDSDNKERIDSLGATFYCIEGDNRDTGIFSNIKYIKKLSKLIVEIKPDKVLTFQAKANSFGVIACKKAGYCDVSAFVEGLGRIYNDGGFKIKLIRQVINFLFKKAFSKIPTVVFLNEENKQRMLDCKLVKPQQCMLINGIGVNLDEFKQEKLLSLDKIAFAMIARVDRDKGVLEYCEAAKRIVLSGVKNVEFNYYGDCDTEKNILFDYVDFVKYHGYSNDIRSALSENHVMVLPSYHEGVPRSLMEACAMSKPIIASDICGCRVCVVAGVNGKLVVKRSIDDLIEKILWFIDNKDEILIMGQASRKLAEEKFDCNIINKQIYDRINN